MLTCAPAVEPGSADLAAEHLADGPLPSKRACLDEFVAAFREAVAAGGAAAAEG